MKNTSLTKFLAVGVSAAALFATPIAASAQDMPGEGVTVNMAQATWDTGWFHAEIYKQLFEELGYAVEGPTTLDNPPFLPGGCAGRSGPVGQWLVPPSQHL